MRRSASPILACAALCLAPPAAASAADPPRTDPELGSPAESVYGIPLEEARRDAAPGMPAGSAIRTENGVGASGRVPGGADDRRRGGEGRDRRREARADADRAAAQLSGTPSGPATYLMIALVAAVAMTGGALSARLTRRG
jgi:hypothetical protein